MIFVPDTNVNKYKILFYIWEIFILRDIKDIYINFVYIILCRKFWKANGTS